VTKAPPHVALGLLWGLCGAGRLPLSGLTTSFRPGHFSTARARMEALSPPVEAKTQFLQHLFRDDWWKLYDDPRLDALIAQALAANTDLRAAAANLGEEPRAF